jgi:hypothetical protein
MPRCFHTCFFHGGRFIEAWILSNLEKVLKYLCLFSESAQFGIIWVEFPAYIVLEEIYIFLSGTTTTLPIQQKSSDLCLHIRQKSKTLSY